MNTELSAFYFDIRKDTLYCDPPSSVARKAALTAIDIICDAILRWLAPVLSFTCEEAWRMYKPNAEPSVHLTLFPEGFENSATTRSPRSGRPSATSAASSPARSNSNAPPRTSARRSRPRRWSMSSDTQHLQHAVRYRSGRSLHHLERDGDARTTRRPAPSASTTCPASPSWSRRPWAPNARAPGRSCRPSAKTPNIPTSRRATRKPCANGRRLPKVTTPVEAVEVARRACRADRDESRRTGAAIKRSA